MNCRSGLTLIETLFALLIAGIIFTLLLRMSTLSFSSTVDTLRRAVAEQRELDALIRYESKRIKGKNISINIKVPVTHHGYYIEYESASGYRGVALP